MLSRPHRPTRSARQNLTAGAVLLALHLAPLAALLTGTRPVDWAVFGALYASGAFGVGVGLHRYFAHRSFKTGRAFQLLIAILASTTFTDPIYFCGKHRLHHRHSDTDVDVHTPAAGFWQCWFGSLLDDGYTAEEVTAAARDWLRFPELRWLRRFYYVPGYTLAAASLAVGGVSMLAIGFCLSRVVIINQASAVNYFCHRAGTRRFDTADDSRNNALVAMLTLGEGWHNNHHHYPAAARAGFAWWEIDPFYWSIRLLALVGLVWDVREPPESIARVVRAGSSW